MEWLYLLPSCSHFISIHRTWDSSFQLGTSPSKRIASESIVLAMISLSWALDPRFYLPPGHLCLDNPHIIHKPGTHFPQPTPNLLLPVGLLNLENGIAIHSHMVMRVGSFLLLLMLNSAPSPRESKKHPSNLYILLYFEWLSPIQVILSS